MLPITFSLFVAPAFKSRMIYNYCYVIDILDSEGKKTNDLKSQLLHHMGNMVDINGPFNKDYQKYFDFVKESIR